MSNDEKKALWWLESTHRHTNARACAGLRILISGEVKQGWGKRAFWSREWNTPLSVSSTSWRLPLPLPPVSDVQSEHLHLFAASLFPDSQHVHPVRLQKKRDKNNSFFPSTPHFSWQLSRKNKSNEWIVIWNEKVLITEQQLMRFREVFTLISSLLWNLNCRQLSLSSCSELSSLIAVAELATSASTKRHYQRHVPSAYAGTSFRGSAEDDSKIRFRWLLFFFVFHLGRIQAVCSLSAA